MNAFPSPCHLLVNRYLSFHTWQHRSSTAATPVRLSVFLPLHCSPLITYKACTVWTSAQGTTTFIHLHSSICSSCAPLPDLQNTDTRRRLLSGGRMMKITTNLSFQQSRGLVWVSQAGHSDHLIWNWYCLGKNMEGNPWVLLRQSEGVQHKDLVSDMEHLCCTKSLSLRASEHFLALSICTGTHIVIL